MRGWLKKHSIGLWAFSFLMAALLWAYVTVVENPERERTISDIPVEFEGELGLLADRGLCILEGHGQTFSLVFVGRQTDLNKLSSDNVKLSVNVSIYTNPGTMNPSVTPVYPDGLSVDVKRVPTVAVVLDWIKEADVEFRLKDNYEVASGYIALDPIFQPSTVRVKGPKTVVDTIAYAEVDIARTNIDKTIENEDRVFQFIDNDNNEVERNNLLTPDIESVLVTLPIQLTKEVPLAVSFIDGGGLKQNENITHTIEPSSITVYGNAEDVAGIDSIILGTIDLDEIDEPQTMTMDIIMPETIANLSGNTKAEVTINFKGIAEASVEVTNIQPINYTVPEGYMLKVVRNSLTVRIRGPEALVNLIQPHHIRVVVDFGGKELARLAQWADADVYLDMYGDEIGIRGSYSIAYDVVEITEDE